MNHNENIQRAEYLIYSLQRAPDPQVGKCHVGDSVVKHQSLTIEVESGYRGTVTNQGGAPYWLCSPEFLVPKIKLPGAHSPGTSEWQQQ